MHFVDFNLANSVTILSSTGRSSAENYSTSHGSNSHKHLNKDQRSQILDKIVLDTDTNFRPNDMILYRELLNTTAQISREHKNTSTVFKDNGACSQLVQSRKGLLYKYDKTNMTLSDLFTVTSRNKFFEKILLDWDEVIDLCQREIFAVFNNITGKSEDTYGNKLSKTELMKLLQIEIESKSSNRNRRETSHIPLHFDTIKITPSNTRRKGTENNNIPFSHHIPRKRRYKLSLPSRHPRRHGHISSGVRNVIRNNDRRTPSGVFDWVIQPPQTLLFSNNTGGIIHCKAVSDLGGRPDVTWNYEDGRKFEQVSSVLNNYIYSNPTVFKDRNARSSDLCIANECIFEILRENEFFYVCSYKKFC